MKFLILSTFILMLVASVSESDATVLENKLLVDSDTQNNSFLTLEFKDDLIQHKKIIPQIASGELIVFNQKIDLEQADIHYMADGNAIVIKYLTNDLGIVMYAKTHIDSDYLINVYLIRNGLFEKTEIKADFVNKSENPQLEPEIIEKKSEIHFLTDQYERVYNNHDYKFFVKTFDKSIYSGSNFDNFQGKINGIKITAIIMDSNGDVKADFSGITESGIYEGSVYVPIKLWQQGWYTVDLVVEHEGNFQFEQLTFYVYGMTKPPDGSNP